jgi:ankyrin repeat protein
LQTDVLATLRQFLACPSQRDVAIKASRLKSLATFETASGCDTIRADAAATAILRALQEAGVDVIRAGSLDDDTTPLIAAVLHSLLGAAQVLLDAGADVNGLSPNGKVSPLCAAAVAHSDAGMAWLLEHGASLASTTSGGHTIAHILASAAVLESIDTAAASAAFVSRWLRRVIAAEPSLLEARDREGRTPLMSAAGSGSEACVAALLELWADVAAVTATGWTALSLACAASCLPVVRQLIAAGAASAATRPPGSPQADRIWCVVMAAALGAERGCGECAARCSGTGRGDCADGLDILRAVLAAGVREAVFVGGTSMAAVTVALTHHKDEASRKDEDTRISAEHALAILQALHAAGVDVLARGPADALPILHEAAVANAPAVVRWLVTEAGAPLEERDSDGDTPLLVACKAGAWAAAHALLDCGARVDVQSTDEDGGRWPLLHAIKVRSCEHALLQRLLAADRDSLLRREVLGGSALHIAAICNTDALKLLLSSGLPHLAEAINAVALQVLQQTAALNITPLHCACYTGEWDAALALLAAGARVDIAGHLAGGAETIAEWARSPYCKHRGVKLAIAARAREHAAQAAAAARGLPAAGADSADASSSAAAAGSGSADAGSRAAAALEAAPPAEPPAAGAGAENGKRRKGKGHKSRRGAASNRAEELPLADKATAVAAPSVGVVASAGAPPAASSAHVPASSAAPASTTVAALSACEDPAAASAAVAASTACSNASDAPAPAARALNLPENPLSQPAVAAGASLSASRSSVPSSVAAVQSSGAAVLTEGSCCGALTLCERAGDAPAVSPCATDANTCEPGAESGSGANTGGPGVEVAASCEQGGGTAAAEAAATPRARAGR